MAEIPNNHQGCKKKPGNNGIDYLPLNWCRISSINSRMTDRWSSDHRITPRFFLAVYETAMRKGVPPPTSLGDYNDHHGCDHHLHPLGWSSKVWVCWVNLKKSCIWEIYPIGSMVWYIHLHLADFYGRCRYIYLYMDPMGIGFRSHTGNTCECT